VSIILFPNFMDREAQSTQVQVEQVVSMAEQYVIDACSNLIDECSGKISVVLFPTQEEGVRCTLNVVICTDNGKTNEIAYYAEGVLLGLAELFRKKIKAEIPLS